MVSAAFVVFSESDGGFQTIPRCILEGLKGIECFRVSGVGKLQRRLRGCQRRCKGFLEEFKGIQIILRVSAGSSDLNSLKIPENQSIILSGKTQ